MDHPRPKKRFGQNFLADRRAAGRIVGALAPSYGEAVLEIGPGRGALTGLLLETGARLAAVEVDRDLAAGLARRWGADRLTLLREDVLRLDLPSVPGLLGLPAGTPLAVVGNLPYNISKPVVRRLVVFRETISRAVLMFQREVAERLTATHGSRRYGPLTVLAGSAFEIVRKFDLPPAAFRPRPAVHSTVTFWLSRGSELLGAGAEPALAACLAACFGSRRRTLRNNLRSTLPGGMEQANGLLHEAGIDGSLRAEAVPPAGFLKLASIWPRS
jgi:16S rRNA (adenine1518-N6/adenine1519-N6)-dimethyltransferase